MISFCIFRRKPLKTNTFSRSFCLDASHTISPQASSCRWRFRWRLGQRFGIRIFLFIIRRRRGWPRQEVGLHGYVARSDVSGCAQAIEFDVLFSVLKYLIVALHVQGVEVFETRADGGGKGKEEAKRWGEAKEARGKEKERWNCGRRLDCRSWRQCRGKQIWKHEWRSLFE